MKYAYCKDCDKMVQKYDGEDQPLSLDVSCKHYNERIEIPETMKIVSSLGGTYSKSSSTFKNKMNWIKQNYPRANMPF